jgi:hypothetical protein
MMPKFSGQSIKQGDSGGSNYEIMARIAPSVATISDSAYANKALLTEET